MNESPTLATRLSSPRPTCPRSSERPTVPPPARRRRLHPHRRAQVLPDARRLVANGLCRRLLETLDDVERGRLAPADAAPLLARVDAFVLGQPPALRDRALCRAANALRAHVRFAA
ncbi:MAG TPA: hypothetical protein RMH85_15760 [Polyangiaceae bacterium LLY-WYZ-15_(1-7)]|nr:hypothetical protein [Myxococcales bacterium]MAT29891.1 hypothetical protein [Sandaracinus sp.]HJK92800.1 hypothetical protein [Polyangiaceae bacterium LLY-WYZ-15_(1-7)]HJL01105.1 hypothetical protein [Polyangiaceae bacterium LLY-WYZ-15_(1-7)]HJL09956.1 hypothetical protein [Polyangiaceae bacterium LLY-WYZ-15_(1-7)]